MTDQNDTPEITDAELPENDDARDSRPEDDRPAIVHRMNFIDDHGVQQQKEIRVPLDEWPAYEKEHGL